MPVTEAGCGYDEVDGLCAYAFRCADDARCGNVVDVCGRAGEGDNLPGVTFYL